MEWINGLGFELWQWGIIFVVALLVGLAKAGLSGVVTLAVPILASAISGKGSVGMMLCMFIVGDIAAVSFYRRHADLKMVRKLSGWVVIGVLAGLFIGKYVNDEQFKVILAVIVLVVLGLMIFLQVKGNNLKVPKKTWVYALTGIVCGVTSMIGNLAGPFFTIYLIAIDFKKDEFMGTLSVFFMMMNLIKLPLQIFFWHNITPEMAIATSLTIPVVVLGVFAGVKFVRMINERIFRYVVIGMTVFASLKLLF